MEHHEIPYLRDIVIFLVAAGVAVPVLHRLRVSPVLGYLIVGAVVGPYGVGLLADNVPWLAWITIADIEGVRTLAEFGVIFLMFVIGLDLSLGRLWAMRRWVFGLGSLQIAITGCVIGAIAFGFGNSPAASLVLGACLALSSTAIVMQLLAESRLLGTPLGRSSFSILLMQDLAVVPILFLVGVLGAQVEGALLPALLRAIGEAAAVLTFIYFAGRVVLRPLLRLVARTRNAEMFMAAILLIIIGTSMLTGAAGLSMALGAFLAGLLLAETEYRHEIEVDIEPFKGLLLGLFFMSVGMGIDYRLVSAEISWLALSVVGLFVIKSAITAVLCRMFGLPGHVSLEAGLLLGQGGEFAFVVVGLAMSLDLLPRDTGQFMLIVTGLTMVVTPLVARCGSILAAKLAAGKATDNAVTSLPQATLEGHIIIAGYGRVGAILARTLEGDAIPYLALDTDAAKVEAASRAGIPVYYGDASRLEMLRRAHTGSARALVITMDNPGAADHVVRATREHWPQLPIVARARDSAHAARLLALGATEVIQETVEASLELSGRLLQLAGVPEDTVRRRIAIQREIELTIDPAVD